MPLPDRVCPVCGLTFAPNKPKQIYDRAECRVKAHRERHKGAGLEAQPEANWMLEQIRRVDPQNALELEQVAKEVGLKYAERMILIGWQLMNRGAIVQAKNVLIEAGEVKPKTRRAKLSKKSK